MIAGRCGNCRSKAGLETRSDAERLLLEEAGTFNPKILAGLGREILKRVDPECADRILAKQFAAEGARAEREREIDKHRNPLRNHRLRN